MSTGRPTDSQQYLELLLRAGEIFEESIDYHETIQNVCEAAVESIADICLLDLGAPMELHMAAAAHSDGAKTSDLRHAGKYLHSDGHGPSHPVWNVFSSETPVLVERVDEAYLKNNSTSAEHEQFMRDLRYGSVILAPLRSRLHGMLGVLTLVRTRGSLPFMQDDVSFAMDLARRCAMAIAKAMLYSETQQIATKFQEAALPQSLPQIPNMGFDAYYEPSSHHMLVGGDWYDAFTLPCGRTAITIGDVLGHGIEAAVWMSRLRNSLPIDSCVLIHRTTSAPR